ncbi:MAG: hypothetical protein HKN37_10975 [Rhodothermales bacterium]|nr:hypothetical protein [Rhodothermales bacterium]
MNAGKAAWESCTSLLADYPVQAVVPALEGAGQDPDPLVRLASARAAASRSVDARSRLTLPMLSDPIKAVRMQAVQILAESSPVSIPPRYAETFDNALVEYRETLRLHADRPSLTRRSVAIPTPRKP